MCRGSDVSAQSIKDYIAPRIAAWWMPDEVVFIEEIPKTGTGKFDKKVVRAEYETLLLSDTGS